MIRSPSVARRVLAACLGLLAGAVAAEPIQRSCSKTDVLAAGGCRLDSDTAGISFTVSSSGQGSLHTLQISPHGLTLHAEPVTVEIDGSVAGAEVADLDGNGWPEVYVYVSSAGSGSYGSLVAYAVNRGKSMSAIYLPPVADDPETGAGYMGHDRFEVVGKRLVHRFPVYQPGDANAGPTGGTRRLQYRLVPGEASWQLVLDSVVDY